MLKNSKLFLLFFVISSCVSVAPKQAVKIEKKTPVKIEKKEISKAIKKKVQLIKPNPPKPIPKEKTETKKIKKLAIVKEVEDTPQKKIIKISAVGDIMLDGTSREEMERYGYDYPFVNVKQFFKDSDIVIGNLEGPLTKRGKPIVKKKYSFRSPPKKVASALANAGFNIVTLANNHALDYGEVGLKDTMDALNRYNIAYIGAGEDLLNARRPYFFNIEGTRIAFLAYSLTFPKEFWAKKETSGTAFGHKKHIKHDVLEAKKQADIVIVSFHWGRATETLRDYQPELGHAAIDAGAALVLGHHPHVLQGIETYKKGVILYSLGNFIFGSYSKTATRTAIANITVEDNIIKEIDLIPLNINNVEVIFQPKLLSFKDAKNVIENLNKLSKPLNTEIDFVDGIGKVVFD